MRRLTIASEVVSGSPEGRRLAEQLARRNTALEKMFTDVVTSFPNGEEVEETRLHKLGDYFENIQIVDSGDANSFRLVFGIRADAPTRFWKDLMVRILASIKDAAPGVAIKSVARSTSGE